MLKINPELTKEDIDIIKEALRYYINKIEGCQYYLGYEFKLKQIEKIKNVLEKLNGKRLEK